eukprot:CAMPEP_0185033018 /NCGR_PEP_ID=MMETSP1103-20130426/21621_1 /TAXON_ID=36769 /ORGANISM="Paraphysomonas bandaiensis, Strain Caron Lab Isolate" /LENGTH=119 /DNA_ID=CAMNT_0027569145 /DNA_START=312 /DNA_END=671 /DNA_ORIENTATION=+
MDAMFRMTRLSADLGNERNWLAWQRTGLAYIRTFFAFLVLSGTSPFGNVAVKIAFFGFLIIGALITALGYNHYISIKNLLMTPEPPQKFGRISNAPLPIAVMLLFLFGIIVTGTQQWEK